MAGTEFLLIRHAVNDFVKSGKLAGWTPGVHLNEEGRAQAEALGRRLAATRIDALYSSPLERTVETAQAVLAHHPHLSMNLLESIGEVRFGAWQGAELSQLSRRKRWFMVQAFPSRVQFPEGETMRGAQLRAIDAIEALTTQHPRQRVALVSHADVIKLVLAHYMGIHLDLFQRLNISPASLSVVTLGHGRVTIQQMNETSYLPEPKRPTEATVEINGVRALLIDAQGEPGQRVFYWQVHHGEADVTTLDLEKAQALQFAEMTEQLFTESVPLPPADSAEEPTLPLQIPFQIVDSTLFRAGRILLQYDPAKDLVQVSVTELRGADQGKPQTLVVWLTRDQLRVSAAQARAVARQGRDQQ